VSADHLIHDCNRPEGFVFRHKPTLQLNDETLRDGLQCPSVQDPPLERKIEILHLMEALEIDAADLGLPGAGGRACGSIERLVREIGDNRLKISPNVAVRTVVSEIQPVVDIMQRTGIPVEACAFIGSSAVRQFAEGWDFDHILKLSVDAVDFGVKHGVPMCYVTEDTTRAHPETLDLLYTAAIEAGARRIVIADTVGHATPVGVRELLRHIRGIVQRSGEDVKIDWHGHQDRALSIPNCMAAIANGADRVHATAFGIGERCGNVPMDLLMVNLQLEKIIDRDLSHLHTYVQAVSEATGIPVPFNYPVFGEDAFRTSTGVHAAAILKAKRKGDIQLADAVYSGVPAHMVGLEQRVEVGFMSGRSNAIFYLEARGIPAEDGLVDRILDAATGAHAILTDEEIDGIVAEHAASSAG
jgi:2-isopropylmalate synthase